LGGLCPPPEAFQGRGVAFDVNVPVAVGGARRRASCVPLGDEYSGCPGVIVVVAPEEAPPAAAGSTPQAAAQDEHARLQQLLLEIGSRAALQQVLGEDPLIARARELVQVAAASELGVAVCGPPGSGRETLARAIHYGGARRLSAPLAPLACNLLDADLLRTTIHSFLASCAELPSPRPAALLLLEVDQLTPDAQIALHDLLCGDDFELRTLATARRSLSEWAAEDKFRRDLACRLGTLEIVVPPLSARPGDIPLLAQHFLEQQNALGGRQLSGFSPEALDQLANYPWPGNVDELAELVTAAARNAHGTVVQADDLPEILRMAAEAAAYPRRGPETIQLHSLLAEVEKELLERALRQSKGNKTKAARLLGVTRARVIRRLEHFGIK
jgi:DNA-binding NtrC family response regulator